MSRLKTRFQWLTGQFEKLTENLNQCEDLEERKQLLQRMKVLIDEIDALASSSLKRDRQDTTNTLQDDQSTGD